MEKKSISELNHNISVDCVIFGFDFENLKVLLIDRDFVGQISPQMALPGDLIYNDENLEQAANRILEELTGLNKIYLEQVGAFGDPKRVQKDTDRAWLKSMRSEPDARVITVAYYSLVNIFDYRPQPFSFAKNTEWINLDEINELAFDHFDILQEAKKNLKLKLRNQPIGFNLLPKKFTLSQLHRLYECILERPLDKRNFRRKILKLDLLINLNEKQCGVPHKPSELYQFNEEKYTELSQNGAYILTF